MKYAHLLLVGGLVASTAHAAIIMHEQPLTLQYEENNLCRGHGKSLESIQNLFTVSSDWRDDADETSHWVHVTPKKPSLHYNDYYQRFLLKDVNGTLMV